MLPQIFLKVKIAAGWVHYNAKLNSKIWIGEGFNLIEEIPNMYYEFSVILYSDKEEEIESSDEEILSLPMKTGQGQYPQD